MSKISVSSPHLRVGLRLALLLLALHTVIVPALILLRTVWPGGEELQRLLDAPTYDLSYLASLHLEPLARWMLANSTLSLHQVILPLEAGVAAVVGGLFYFVVAFVLGAIVSKARAFVSRGNNAEAVPPRAA